MPSPLRNMTQPRLWKEIKRHEESARYKDLSGPTWEKFIEGVRKFGILGGRAIVMYEGKILDGWQLQRACVECDVTPTYVTLPEGMSIEEYVEYVNDVRRHETQEQVEARISERRERIAKAYAEGKSKSSIAASEGVSRTTVHSDLSTKKNDDVTPDIVENSPTQEEPVKTPEKVVGKDGKEYPATKPKTLCDHCAHRQSVGKPLIEKCEECAALKKGKAKAEPKKPKVDKGGGVLYPFKQFESSYGALLREIDNFGNAYKCKESNVAHELRRDLSAFRKKFTEWFKDKTGGVK